MSAALLGTEISAGCAYPLAEFMRRTGLGWKSLRRARSEGLRVVKIGSRSYVRGSDWLEHLERMAAQAEG